MTIPAKKSEYRISMITSLRCLLLLVPQLSAASTEVPSLMPSEYPANSDMPSLFPLSHPTGVPSFVPSDHPSDIPSLFPSDIPSLLPSQVPSRSPSRFPSGRPSEIPSYRPSKFPTEAPSIVPSKFPSPKPSSNPSASPSILPTFFPTHPPTPVPTNIPSSSPSLSPSTSPSYYCHDVASYHSPVNGLGCAAHNGTDCTNWRFLGLTVDEVERLLNSCPVSCGIECGSVERNQVKIQYKLMNVETFLSSGSVIEMEHVSLEYLTNFVKAKERDSSFFLYRAELLSQQIVERAYRQLRALEDETGIALLVEVTFKSIVIDLDTEKLKGYLIEGLDSKGYTQSLQRSGVSAFANVIVSTQISGSSLSETASNSDDGPSPGGVAAAVVCSIVSLVGIFGWFVHSKGKARARAFARDDQVVIDDLPNSPSGSAVSKATGFSFEVASNYASRVARLVTSFSPRSPSVRSEATNSESSESAEEEHPYSGIIPPMIVIDHFDSDDVSYKEDNKERKKKIRDVVPSMRIQASSDMIAALHDQNNPWDLSGYLASHGTIFPSSPQSPLHSNQEQMIGIQRSTSFHVLSTDEESASLGSKPVLSDENIDTKELRRVKSEEGTTSVMEKPKLCYSQSDVATKKMSAPPATRTRPPRARSDSSQRSSPRSTSASPVVMITRTLSDSPVTQKPLHSDIIDGHQPVQFPRKESIGFFASLWSRSPHSKATPSSIDHETIDNVVLPDHIPGPSHSRTNSRGSSIASGSKSNFAEDGNLHFFQAPSKGKLGLVIKCEVGYGPVVTQVKDYSPLLGQIEPGDKIVSVDGTKTENLSLHEVMHMLSGRYSWSSNVRLTVWRPVESACFRDDSPSRLSLETFLSSTNAVSGEDRPTANRQQSPLHFNIDYKAANDVDRKDSPMK